MSFALNYWLQFKVWTSWKGRWVTSIQENASLHKRWSFQLMISSVNVTKSAGNCGFGHIYWRNPWLKNSFFCAVPTSNELVTLFTARYKNYLSLSSKYLALYMTNSSRKCFLYTGSTFWIHLHGFQDYIHLFQHTEAIAKRYSIEL